MNVTSWETETHQLKVHLDGTPNLEQFEYITRNNGICLDIILEKWFPLTPYCIWDSENSIRLPFFVPNRALIGPNFHPMWVHILTPSQSHSIIINNYSAQYSKKLHFGVHPNALINHTSKNKKRSWKKNTKSPKADPQTPQILKYFNKFRQKYDSINKNKRDPDQEAASKIQRNPTQRIL